MRHILLPLLTATLPLTPVVLYAQVTTATLYGVVRDTTAGSVPGALVTVLNQGTGQSREIVTDATGEFALTALPTGRYTLKIELQGFKTYTNDGLDLGAGQTVRQTFTLEVGQLAETITVSETRATGRNRVRGAEGIAPGRRGTGPAARPAQHHEPADAVAPA